MSIAKTNPPSICQSHDIGPRVVPNSNVTDKRVCQTAMKSNHAQKQKCVRLSLNSVTFITVRNMPRVLTQLVRSCAMTCLAKEEGHV